MKLLSKNCLCCFVVFYAKEAEVKRGFGKFCTQKCSSIYSCRLRKEQIVPNVKCEMCEKPFYRSQSKQKLSKASGMQFCSRKCKDEAQCIQNGKQALHPFHYGDGRTTYRETALRFYEPKCARCGFNQPPEILVVHHRDCNRSNGSIENLEILCPNCHEIHHFMTKTGKWRPKSVELVGNAPTCNPACKAGDHPMQSQTPSGPSSPN